MKKISLLIITILFLYACTEEMPFALQDAYPSDANNVLSPCKMTRAQAMNLILSHGVGYGYNGIDGEECNVPDVRSQVLDPNAIIDAGITFDINKIEGNEVHFGSSTGFSLNELLEKVYFGGNGSANLAVVFKGSVRGTLMLYSQKKINSYYCTAKAYKNAFYSMIDGPSVSASIDEYPEILTKGFRSAIARLGKNPTKMQMDSLINRYGTHVVTKCTLGGMLNLDVRLEKDSILTISQQNAIGEVALMSFFNHDSQGSDDEYDLKIINSGDSRLTVRGGDSRRLEQTLMNFNWGREAVKPQDVDDWLTSIGTDEDKQQTLEMTSMEMMPIWEFIPDPHVAKMLEAHITGNAQLMFELYGYQNFVNTSFPAFFQEGKERQWYFQNDTGAIQPPSTQTRFYNYNIEAGGRYVATAFLEQIPEIDINGPVWVAYPIYQQDANISTGLCIHNGKAYRVGWKFGQIEVSPIVTESVSDKIYMTGGYLYPQPTPGINYEKSHVVYGYEWPGSIKTDGSINAKKPVFTTYKENDRFYLVDVNGEKQQGALSALPNWTYNSSLNRMVRNNNYSYFYSPKEVAYINSHPEFIAYGAGNYYIKENGCLSGITSKSFTISQGANVTLLNAEIFGNVIIDGDNVTLNLKNAIIHGQINCNRSATINLEPVSRNYVLANESGLSAIRCASGQLTIKGAGKLKAVGGEGAAGIGSNENELLNYCNINMEGVSVTAYGGNGGAGIGSGRHSSCGSITVSGCYIDANSSGGGAGIGTGQSGRCNNITVGYSNINILANDGGAGIGTGSYGSSCGDIRIYETDGSIHASINATGVGNGYNSTTCGDLIFEHDRIYIDAGTPTNKREDGWNDEYDYWDILDPPL